MVISAGKLGSLLQWHQSRLVSSHLLKGRLVCTLSQINRAVGMQVVVLRLASEMQLGERSLLRVLRHGATLVEARDEIIATTRLLVKVFADKLAHALLDDGLRLI